MRSVSRVLGISINTVTKLLVESGSACQAFHDMAVRSVESEHIECDEIWSFAYAKEPNAHKARGVIDGAGDIWTWTAIDRDTKLMISWMVGGQDQFTARMFAADLESRLDGRVQISTDGNTQYIDALDGAFGGAVDYATDVRGSKRRVLGSPDLQETGTEKVEHHSYAMALFAAWYNWVRPHQSLSTPYDTTPAMAAGLTSQLNSMDWLMGVIDRLR